MSVLSHKRLLFISGKGGVGKSSIAAALALHSAQTQAQTLLVELHASNHLAHLLGLGAFPLHPEPAEPCLWTVRLEFQSALKEYALSVLRFEPLYRAAFENRWTQKLLHFIPSLQELVLLGKLLHHAQEKTADGLFRFDKIIVDAPATGHASRLLSLPNVLLRTVPPGALAEDALRMQSVLQAPTTAALLVSLPAEMAVQETLELHHSLQTEVHIDTAAVLLNRFVAPLLSDAELLHPALLQQHGLLQLAQQHHRLAHASQDALSRLSQLPLPAFTLPQLPFETPARTMLLHMAECLSNMEGLL